MHWCRAADPAELVLVLVGCRFCDLHLLGSRASLPRLAQGVLSREEPEESFLKGVPSEPDSLELIFPVLPPTPCLVLRSFGEGK